ncbi:hypothetical protein CSPAE12_04501 [Colletotrichum incanum]|nr:hypothetical protein CSPAE12_04501 [Colletotrichum incanum]
MLERFYIEYALLKALAEIASQLGREHWSPFWWTANFQSTQMIQPHTGDGRGLLLPIEPLPLRWGHFG